MVKPRKTSDDDWPVTWEASRSAQLADMARATPAQRLVWLERALRLAQATGALSRADDPDRRRRRGIA